MDEKPANGSVTVERVRTRHALSEFAGFVYQLRGTESHWIPPLRRDQATLLNRLRHPFHEHAQVEYYTARRGGKVAGRIAAIENFAHNKAHNEKAGFFGFLEAERDPDVFLALLTTAESWARKRGLTVLRGPCSFSTNEECGLLVENFDSDPAIMMSYHPPYYREFVESAGYSRAEDLLCYWVGEEVFTGRIARVAAAATKRLERSGAELRIRYLDKSRWREEVATVKRVYNQAWEQNWGFVPLTSREMDFLAKELRPIVDPNLVVFAEVGGEIAGFALGLPDFNVILKHLDGRLGPRQVLTFLMLRRQIKQMRLLMLGVLPEFRNKGLDMILIHWFAEGCRKVGIHQGELSWILDRNEAMKHGIEATGARLYRRYRIYEKRL
ncbi:N-acetyltransferase [Candidatus Poribacteria bacterium]|nr:N-acetyltransferase [Candidatus Poribacteria bacterium]